MAASDIVVIINSFNRQKYVSAALNLYACVIPHVKHVIIVFGGCNVDNKTTVKGLFTEYMTILSIAENLSDWNGFLAYRRAAMQLVKYKHCLHVYLHDTCLVAPGFADAMTRLDVIKEMCIEKKWTFAHTYGLYNIGVCSQDFIVAYGAELDGLTVIPKELAIQLEQGHRVTINNREINPLRAYSETSLCSHTHDSDQFERGDSFFVNSFSVFGEKRFVSYIGSLCVYKAVGSRVSYFVPIWCHPEHQVDDSASLEYVKNMWTKHYIHCDGVESRLSDWLPLPSIKTRFSE